MILFWVATVLPAALLLIGALPSFVSRWRASGWLSRVGVLLIWACLSVFMISRPHDDSLTGLDNMAYRKMTSAFLQGRGFHDRDEVLAMVPEALRENFLYHRGPVGRPTRDRVFRLDHWRGIETQPFFMPALSLAAAGHGLLGNPDSFVPMLGSLWLAAVLVAGFAAGGGWGILAVLALLVSTAWPAWFLRGFYAEAAGVLLAGMSLVSLSLRSRAGVVESAAAFMLGLSTSFHPTMLVIAIPPLMALLMGTGGIRGAMRVLLGFVVGVAPLVAMMKWVCQPYGDLLSLSGLLHQLKYSPEHRAVALLLVGLLLAAASAIVVCNSIALRGGAVAFLHGIPALAWFVVAAAPVAVILVAPGSVGEALRLGGSATWRGFGWPAGALFMLALIAALSRERPLREKLLSVALCWSALLFIFVKGVETPVGLWSQRRFLPVVIICVSVFAMPLASHAARLGGGDKRGAVMVAALLLVCGGWNIARWPAPFGDINERGASAFTKAIANKMGPEPLVVFDYFPHSVPYAAELRHKVLGLGEGSREHWPEVAEWLAGVAATQEVWVASSWSPTALEEGLRLEQVFCETGMVSHVSAKTFFPAVRRARPIFNSFARAVPVAGGGSIAQDKVLDGSPFGLRGPWGRVRGGGSWSREGSGIIGPVPAAGGEVRVTIECAWSAPEADWQAQTMRLLPPWGGVPFEFDVSNGCAIATGAMLRPEGDAIRPATGAYVFSAEKPYDPGAYGLRGYHGDLGVVIRRVVIDTPP